MKQPINNFRYTITNILGTTVGVAAFGEGAFSIEWNFEDGGPYDYSKEFPSKIVFREAVYQNLLSIETTSARCDLMTMTAERFCAGGWVPWFTGQFSLNDGTWDKYRCEVEIKMEKVKPGGCLDANKNQEINLFEEIPAVDRVTVHPYNTAIVIEKVTYTLGPYTGDTLDPAPYWAGPGTPGLGAWAYYYNYYSSTLTVLVQQYKQTKWARQTLTLPVADPSPGAEWILISTAGGFNKWAKPASFFDCKEEEIINEGTIIYAKKRECKILGEAGGISQIDNGMTLKDCLEAFAQKFCPGMTVKSEFFQINPDTVTATNYVTGATSKIRNIVVYQKSDVKRPGVSGNATKAVTNWEKFSRDLREMFNVQWRISGSILRVEHISYFAKNAGFDLTLPKYAKYVRGLEKYSYKTEQIPQREEFKFMEASAGDFAGLPIIYQGGCVSQGGRDNITPHAADDVTTDVELIMNNPASDSSVVDDKGFVFIAVDPSGVIFSEPPILDAGTRLNNVLSWAHLHRDFHKHNRALKSGIMNGAPTSFLSVRPLKKGVTLTVPLCCDDVFNPDDTIETALGTGTVEKASFSFKSDMLSLDLVYPFDADLYIAAIANNDITDAEANVLNVLDVVANDTPSPSEPITIIEIVTAPMHGTAVVAAGPVINYTPSTNYYGPDNIVYRVKGAAGIPSNNALVALNVKSAIFARMEMVDNIFEPISVDCSGTPTHVGHRQKATFRVYFYLDALGFTPANTTGLGITLNIQITGIYGDPGNAATVSTFTVPASASYVEIFTDYTYFEDTTDCDGNRDYYQSENIALAPGAYTVI